jgi:4-hydroxy-3-polyprenylbenzoate decarboxylase
MDAAEMAEQFVCRVLAHIGLPQAEAYVWKGETLPNPATDH